MNNILHASLTEASVFNFGEDMCYCMLSEGNRIIVYKIEKGDADTEIASFQLGDLEKWDMTLIDYLESLQTEKA